MTKHCRGLLFQFLVVKNRVHLYLNQWQNAQMFYYVTYNW